MFVTPDCIIAYDCVLDDGLQFVDELLETRNVPDNPFESASFIIILRVWLKEVKRNGMDIVPNGLQNTVFTPTLPSLLVGYLLLTWIRNGLASPPLCEIQGNQAQLFFETSGCFGYS